MSSALAGPRRVRLALTVSALFLAVAACACARETPVRPRIVVVGWDGADWEALHALSAAGRMPHLARLLDEGVSGRLASFQPMLSPLIWTSIATGKEPPDHGILDFLSVDPGSGRLAPVTSDRRRTRALWNILGDRGLRSAFVGWLVTFPAEPVAGTMVSDRVSILSFARHAPVDHSPPRGKTHPPELYAEIEPLIVQPAEIDDATVRERFDLQVLPDEEALQQLRATLAQTETYRRIALRLLERRDVDLFAVYFEAIDAMSHLFIRYTPPPLPGVSPEDVARYGHLVEATYAMLDGVLGEILARTPADTTLYLVSDHGFKMGAERIPFEDSSMRDAYAADWHRDNGVLVVRGPGVRRGGRIEEAGVLDLAPTLLAQLGVPAGRDMPGRVLVDLWRPDAAPVVPERVASYDTGSGLEAAAAPEPASDPDAEKLLEKLAALGYVAAGRAAVYSNESSNLASYYAHRGAYPLALRAAQAAVDANPKNAGAWKALGEIHIRLGEHAEAIPALAEVASLRPNAIEVRVTLAGLYEQVGEHVRAIALLEPLAGSHPDDPRIPARLGTLYARAGRYAEAGRQYERSLALYPGQDRVRYELLAARAFEGRGDEVLRSLEEEPPDAEIDLPLELAKVFFKLGEESRADAALTLASRRSPAKAEPHFYRGLLELRRRDPQAALASFDAALERQPDYTAARLNKGLAYLRAGRSEEAIATLEAILRDAPDYAPAHTLLGEAHLARGEIDEARGHLERALELDPRAPRAAALLARIPEG